MKPIIYNVISSAPSSRRKAARRGRLLTLGLLAMSMVPSQGAEFTWTGTTNSSWTDSGNWAGGIAPTYDGTADVVLPTPTAANPSLQGTLGAVYDIRTLTVQSSGYALQGSDPGTLQLERGMTVNSPTTNNFYCDPQIKLGGDNTWNIAADNHLRPRSIDFGSGHTLTKTGSGSILMDWPVLGLGVLNHQGGDIYLRSTTPAPFTSVRIGSTGNLWMDYSSSGAGSRLSATAPITMNSGRMILSGKSGEAVTQSLADVSASSGLAHIVIIPNGGTRIDYQFASLTRSLGGLFEFNSWSADPLGGTVNKILITNSPTLINGVLPYAQIGDSDLATYDAVNGVTIASYQSTTIAGSTAVTDNVNGVAVETLTVDKTINALTLTSSSGYGAGLNLGGKTLTVTSGTVILGKPNESIDGGTLDFGTAEGAVSGAPQSRLSPGGGLTITGSGGMTIAGDHLSWGGTAAWTGTTTVVTGIFLLNNGANSFPDGYPLVIAGGGSVNVAGNPTTTEVVGSLAGAGGLGFSSNYKLVAGGDNTSTTFSGQMNGKFAFVKQGSGTFTYDGTEGSDIGAITVDDGTLLVNGTLNTQPDPGPVTVEDGTLLVNGTLNTEYTFVREDGTLGGNGTITGDIYIRGIYQARIDSSGTPTADKITAAVNSVPETGDVDLTGAILQLADRAANQVLLPQGTTLPILSYAGVLEGFFTSDGETELEEGATVKAGINTFTIHYGPNAVTLTSVATNPFDSWMAGFDFSAFTSPDLTPQGDPDNDGIANAVEYVIGNQPNVNKVENLPTNTLVTDPAGVTPTGDYMRFAYRRTTASGRAGVTSAVRYDVDLVGTWTTAVNGVDGVTILEAPNALLPGTDVQVFIPRAAKAKLFGRLAVDVP